MAQPQLGEIEVLGLRDLWKHEERDFTPWLAQNIDRLSAALGVPVVVDQIEHKVGNYELDILGHVEENDAVVIIENQRLSSDHGHLGQLITYAAGLEAAIVIWIAGEVRDEHRSAIKWLNNHTDEKVSFFWSGPRSFVSISRIRQSGSSSRPRQANLVIVCEASSRRKIARGMSFVGSFGKTCFSTLSLMVIRGQKVERQRRIRG